MGLAIVLGLFVDSRPAEAASGIQWIGGSSNDDWTDVANWNNPGGPFLPDQSFGESACIGVGDNPQIISNLGTTPRFILIDGGTIDHSAGLVDMTEGGPELGNGNKGLSVYNLSGGELRMDASRYSDVNIGLMSGSGLSSFNISGTGHLNQTAVQDLGRGIQVGRMNDGELNLSDSATVFTAGTLRNGGDSTDGVGIIRIFGGDVSIQANDYYSQDATATLDLHFSATNTISPINTSALAKLDGILRAEFQTPPSLNDQYTIINTGSGVEGIFSAFQHVGLPGGLGLGVNYAGGDGNDVVLQIVSDTGARSWLPDAAGDINAANNWSGGLPNADSTAEFGDAITSSRTVFTDEAFTVGGISFNNANTYAVAGTGSVTLVAGNLGDPTINVTLGTHEFQTHVALGNDTTADIAAGAALEFDNDLNLGGHNLTKAGDGRLSINNALNTGNGTVSATAGVVAGSGVIGGDLTNSGATVAPGNSPGILTVDGNYNQTSGGTLAIEIGGTQAGMEYDVLNVLGDASLAGTLDVSLIDGFTPGGGDTFKVLTAGGDLTDVGLTLGGSAAGSFAMSIDTTNDWIMLMVAGAGLAGDFSGNGVVDAADYTIYRDNLGGDSSVLGGNGTGAATVVQADYDLWKQNFGNSSAGSSSGAAVPEPSTLIILGLGLAGLASRSWYCRT